MARKAIGRFRYLLVSAVILASAVLAGAANWPNH
jgi:outer membrane murein-binding lipoprotein Lpp